MYMITPFLFLIPVQKHVIEQVCEMERTSEMSKQELLSNRNTSLSWVQGRTVETHLTDQAVCCRLRVQSPQQGAPAAHNKITRTIHLLQETET